MGILPHLFAILITVKLLDVVTGFVSAVLFPHADNIDLPLGLVVGVDLFLVTRHEREVVTRQQCGGIRPCVRFGAQAPRDEVEGRVALAVDVEQGFRHADDFVGFIVE